MWRRVVLLGCAVAILGACSSLREPSEPPGASVLVDGQPLVLAAYTYCWQSGGAEGCSDGVLTDGGRRPATVVTAGAEGVVEFDTSASPRSLRVWAAEGSPEGARTELPVDGGRFVLDVPPGDWYLDLSTLWRKGDVAYGGAVRVRKPGGR
jgi:hypothetical protein